MGIDDFLIQLVKYWKYIIVDTLEAIYKPEIVCPFVIMYWKPS